MQSKLLLVVSILFLLVANFSFWISGSIYDSENFKQNVLTSFKKQEVRDAVASGVVDRILEDNPALQQLASSPAQAAISGILNSSFLEPVVEKTAEKLQQYVTTGQEAVTLDLTPVNTVVSGIARATGNTEQTPQIRNTNIEILPANAFPAVDKWLKPITTIGPILGVIGLGLLIFAVFRAANRMLALRDVGIYLAVGVGINILLLPFISSLIRQNAPTANAGIIAAETFNGFAQSYFSQLVFLAVIGVILIFLGYFWPKYYQNK